MKEKLHNEWERERGENKQNENVNYTFKKKYELNFGRGNKETRKKILGGKKRQK